jgi:hypothetical protein
MTDEKTRQLENRIDKLESTIEKMMPSRRDALKMGGAALVGGAAMSGRASAGGQQVGTIGDKDATPEQRVDVHSEDIDNADTITTGSIAYSTTPPGTVVTLSSDQTLADGTPEIINFDTTQRGDDLINSNNEVVIPSGFEYAKLMTFLECPFTGFDIDVFEYQINGEDTSPPFSLFDGGGALPIRADRFALPTTPWIEVSSGDKLDARIRQVSGSADELEQETYMEVWLH